MKRNILYNQDFGTPPPPPPPGMTSPSASPVSFSGSGVDINKMAGDMKFVALWSIISGAISCIGCISAIWGIPIIMSGLRLKEAANGFISYAGNSDKATLEKALYDQGRYFFIQKILIIIVLILLVLEIIILIIFAITGNLSSFDF
jgi:hypothetical protein